MFFYSEIIQNIIKNWYETQILSGSFATQSGDQFGSSISMNSAGDRIIVGVFADETNADSPSSGLAYIFVSGSDGWIQQQVLSGSLATQSFDVFGHSVSMNSAGDRVIIGARQDERVTQSASQNEGLAYIFVSGSDGWIQQQILIGSLSPEFNDYFGYSVSMNSAGDRVVIGSLNDEAVGGSSSTGLAYIFVSASNGWRQQQILTGSLATQSGDMFGFSVAINSNGNRVVVGARQDQSINSAGSSGLAYVFVSSSNGWNEQHILSGSLATNGSDQFGRSVAMNSAGDRIVIGAADDEASGAADASGLAYIFVSSSNGWTEQHIFSGTLATGSSDYFGWSVSMNSAGDRVIVGAIDDEAIGETNGSGLAYMFVSSSGGWIQQQILSGSLTTSNFEYFGHAVAINSVGDRVVVGATNDEASGSQSATGLVYINDYK